MRKLCYRLHLWAGVTIGAWFSVAGLTGSLLVFRPEIERATGEAVYVEPSGAIATLESMLAAVERAGSNAPIRYIFPGASASASWVFELGDGTRLFVDPYRPAVLRTVNPKDTFFGCIREWHADMFTGSAGSKAVGFLGAASGVLLATGLVVWWPRKRSSSGAKGITAAASRRPAAARWHRIAGVASAPLLLLVVFTGVALAWGDWINRASKLFVSSPAPAARAAETKSNPLPWRDVLARADAALPGMTTTRITLPGKGAATAVVRKRASNGWHPNGMNFVHVGVTTGEVLLVRKSTEQPALLRWLDNRFPLHIGAYGGLVTRALHAAAGLLPAALFVTGLILASRRLRSRSAATRQRSVASAAQAEAASAVHRY